ncbi:hypothetical protein F4781DRAFT_353453 [Annulohypoxylon bovei var. microspora]|nr:hypothetical protein F4781DRAFT_353453 [Annulohypoxylon bovei var. microspora]
MANPSGRIAGPIRWHIYREPQPPNTRMALGSILTKPDDLETSLNYGSGIEAVPPEKRENCTTMVQRIIKSELSKDLSGKLSALLPTVPGVSGGGGLEGARSSNAQATFVSQNVRAQIISPETAKEYMDRALLGPKVLEFVRGCLFTKPLYLIVGVATCSNLTASETRSGSRSGSAKAAVSAMGTQVTGSFLMANQGSVGNEFVVDDECDFAYRVREFQYSRRRKVFKKSSDVTDGAMFSRDDEDTDMGVDDEGEEVAQFEYLEDEDEDVESDGVTLGAC